MYFKVSDFLVSCRRSWSCLVIHMACRLLFGLLMACLLSTASLAAQEQTTPDLLTQSRQTLEQMRSDLATQQDEAHLAALWRQGLQAYGQLNGYTESLAPHRAELAARQAELGEAPPGDAEEPEEISAQRAQVGEALLAADAQSRLAGLLKLELEQTLADISNQRRALFRAQLGQRSPSILGGRFWVELSTTLAQDGQYGQAMREDLRARMGGLSGGFWGLVAVWLAAALVLYRWLRVRLLHLAASKVPSGRLRRCSQAWFQAALAALMPSIVLGSAYITGSWLRLPADGMSGWFAGLAGTAAYLGYAAGLWYVLLAPRQPSWRLPPIDDVAAARLGGMPQLVAGLLLAGWLVRQMCDALNMPLILAILGDTVLGLLLSLALLVALLPVGLTRHDPQQATGMAGDTWLAELLRRWRWPLQCLYFALALVALASLLGGYVVFAGFLLQQMIWSLVLLATAYLLSITVKDLAGLLTERAEARELRRRQDDVPGRRLAALPGLSPMATKQWITLLAGLAQAAIALFAVPLLFASYGSDMLNIGLRMQHLRSSLSWGHLQLHPVAIVQALALLLLGAWVVRVVKRWLAERLLPLTTLEPSVQSSLSTLTGYLGYMVVAGAALASVGVQFEKATWIASALSVGIGFGLQAIVQNFVSGIILLAERPVKVGDWVALGGVEGDIRRINVRTTEIQLSDRSTVIMPNSEFVTKMVRNVTYADSLGRVQIKLPMPLGAPTAQVREIILRALAENETVLPSPAPNVYLEEITPSGQMFNALAYVAGPRLVYGTRSVLLYDIMARLDCAGLLNWSRLTPAGNGLWLAPGATPPGAVPTPEPPA
jgi:small-conductance mechanosensitive channel